MLAQLLYFNLDSDLRTATKYDLSPIARLKNLIIFVRIAKT